VVSTIKVAIIGAGGMGAEHARAFASLPGVVVAGVTSRTREKATALAERYGAVAAVDVAELHRKTTADLAIIAVPELAANAVAKLAFAFPWAVLLEKPAGYDLADAEDIAAASRGRAAPVMVGLNRRFYGSTLALRADLDTRPDEPRFVHVQDQQSFAEARRYHHPEQVVERFMYANSIHLLDLIPALARGTPTEVRPITPWRGEATEVMLAHISYDSCDTALYEGLWQGPGPWAVSVSTRSRRWTMQPLEQATYQNAGERTRHPVEAEKIDRQFKPGLRRQAEAAVARVRGEASAIPSLAESLETMRLIHRIFGV
jgi:predicted dehydrogenase